MRKRLIVTTGLLLALFGLLAMNAVATLAASADVVEPLGFYASAPDGWQSKGVGTLLKWERERDTCDALKGLKGYRVMYVSRGALGEKTFETGMVFFPTRGSAPKAGRSVMAWDHGTAGVGESAAPSRYPWLYPTDEAYPWDWSARWVGHLGRMGYVVACPDYEGLGTPDPHTYMNAESQARSTIDAVRAARQLAGKMGVRVSREWGVAGHSQGGMSALAAAEWAPSYAKELSLLATVAVSPATEMPTLLSLCGTSDAWPYLGYCAAGIQAVDPDFDVAELCGPGSCRTSIRRRTTSMTSGSGTF